MSIYQDELADFKRSRSYDFVDALPLNAKGEILKC